MRFLPEGVHSDNLQELWSDGADQFLPHLSILEAMVGDWISKLSAFGGSVALTQKDPGERR